MLTLEKEPSGEVTKEKVKSIIADILGKEPNIDVAQVEELVNGLFAGKANESDPTITRDALRKCLVKQIPKINSIYGDQRPKAKARTPSDIVMQELEKNINEEISEAELIDALIQIGGKPTDPIKIAEIAKGIMLGNKSVSRSQVRYGLNKNPESVASVTGSPKTKNAVIDEILKDLENDEHLSEDKIKAAVRAAAEAHAVDPRQMEKLIQEMCAGAEKDNNGEIPRHALRQGLEAKTDKFDKLFGEQPGEKSPADMVMQQLELSSNAKLSVPEIVKAITESARLNGKMVDPRVLQGLADSIARESPNLSRGEIRAALEKSESLQYAVAAPPKENPLTGDVMKTLETY